MEVVKDGVVYKDKAVVINEWGSQYSALYNFKTNNTVPSLDYNTRPSDLPLIGTGVDSPITLDEVMKCLTEAKCGKSIGVDMIPMEVLNSDTACHFPQQLF